MKNLRVTVNGIEYEVQVEDLDESSASSVATQPRVESKPQPKPEVKKEVKSKPSEPSSGAESVNAPMPGVIMSVNVNEGDKVSKGQVLVILEAMKMENEIMSPKDGIIESVNVKKGENVESGSPLVLIK